MTSLAAQTGLILRNDLRLLWRDLSVTRWKNYLSGSLIAVLFLIFNAISITLFFVIRRQPPLGAETLAWLFFGFLMLGAAMNHAISVLFERADFDLLLASPVSPRAILLARLATMTAGAALSVALLLLPLINGALFALSWHYTTGYAVWLLLSCAVASGGVWFTLLLVKWLGPRRARTWSQVVAAGLGASVYLGFQGQNFIPIEQRIELVAQASRFFSHPAIAFIARAGRGEAWSLLALAIISAGFAAATTRLLGRMFISGVQEAGGITPSRKSGPARRHMFVEGVMRATFWKDTRLIVRDPLLLAQVLPTALYILPAVFGFSRFGGVGLLAPVALVIASQFSFALTAVCASGEECWDLIRMSPTSELRLRFAKMAAGMALPVALSAVACAVLALFGHPFLALLALVFSVACAAACAWLQVTQIKPTPRRDVLKRGSGRSFGRGFAAGMLMLMGAGGLGLAATGHGIASAILLGVDTLLVVACFVLVDFEEIRSRDFPGDSSSVVYGARE
jgi:ABC-2 type transport system permease protein